MFEKESSKVNAALLYRVSTDKQKEKFSLPSQRRILKELAVKQNWNIIEYDEGAVSGTKLVNRPIMLKLLKDIEEKKIDIVCVIEIERLTRDVEGFDRALIFKTFREHSIKIITPSQEYNPRDVEDDFLLDLLGILSKREIRKKSERCRRGILEAKLQGKWLGGLPPTGYKYNYQEKKLELDTFFASVVKKIFTLALKKSINQILIELTKNNIPTTRGGKWDNTRIRRILKNVFYTGYIDVDGKLVKGQHPPIISMRLYNKVRAAIRQRVSHNFITNPASLLIGLLYCGECYNRLNTAVLRKKRNEQLYIKRYYRCRGRSLKICDLPMIQQDFLEPIVLRKINELLNKEKIIEDIYNFYLNSDLWKQRLKEIKKETIGIQNKKQNLIIAVENNAIDMADISKRMQELNLRQRALEKEQDEIMQTAKTKKSNFKVIKSIIQNFRDNFEKLDFDGKRELLASIIEKIIITRENAYIYLKFLLPNEDNKIRIKLYKQKGYKKNKKIVDK